MILKAIEVFHDYFVNIISQIIISLAIFLWFWMNKRITAPVRCFRHLAARLTNKKYIIVWNDDEASHSKKIIASFRKKYPGYKYCSLKRADEILRYPLNPKAVQLLLFIVTDVTKLAEEKNTRDTIQSRIVAFVEKGGSFIGTHDIIYKRTRNEILHINFGCEITNFKRESKPIEYQVAEHMAGHPILEGIESEFTLDDGEVCWGNWSQDTEVLIHSKKQYDNKRQIPLFVLCKYGKGFFVWMNSCDKKETLCESISQLQPAFTALLLNTLKYSEVHCQVTAKKEKRQMLPLIN